MTSSSYIEIAMLRNAQMFQNLSDEALSELAKRSQYMELAAGETLFHQDDPGDALYILGDGQVHIVRKYPSGEEIILTTENPYYVIGELSMLVGQPRTGSVVAVSDCALLALSREALMEVCERIPDVATKVMTYVSLRLYRMNLVVREHAIGNIQARVASVLLLLAGSQTGQVVHEISINRIARAVAIDADAVERILKEWDQLDYVRFVGGSVSIRNVKALQNIAG
jgi:CRP-like cAMP-binding protein